MLPARFVCGIVRARFRDFVPSVRLFCGMTCEKPFKRLSPDVVPQNYKLRITPDFMNYIFHGTEEVEVLVKKPVTKVELNSKELTYKCVTISTDSGDITPSTIDVIESEEKVEFTLPQPLVCGKATLKIEFDGIINDSMCGFYRSKYTSIDGVVRPLAVTQFEATSARKAFPCWDEPACKATFDITLDVPRDMMALSNMPVASTTPKDSLVSYAFERTPKMSTYLVAYAIGHFECVSGETSNGVKVSVYTQLGRKHEGQFALDVSVKTLPFYDGFFGTPYPLPKCDLIAIPEFQAGAMENWGLVTFRETALLIDPTLSSPSGYQRVALVVGHELAHQWFGNLVTMEWWTDLWLNEGFATWVEYLCVDHCHPEYDIWTQFLNDDYARAQNLDSLRNTHPIQVTVGHPDEIDEIFDAISYSKGASVIRMLNSYLTPEEFQKGLKYYLDKFKYQNAHTKDLWESLEFTSKKPISSLMSTWTEQGGYPFISVEVASQDATKTVLSLKQDRFFADVSSSDNSSPQLWHVPITVVTSEKPNIPVTSVLMTTREISLEVPTSNIPAWIKLNHGQSGFYRILYSAEMMSTLTKLLSTPDCPFTPIERHGLQNDLYWMAKTGKVPTASYLQLFANSIHDTNYTLWSDRLSSIGAIRCMLQYCDQSKQCVDALNSLIRCTVRKVYDDFKPQGHLDHMLHSMLFAALGRAHDQEIIAEARKLFTAYIKENKQIDKNLRGAVFSVVLSHATAVDLNDALKIFETTTSPEEKIQVLRCLGMCGDAEISKKVLEFSFSPKVLNQDRVFCIASTTYHPESREISWEYVKSHFEELKSFYPHGGYLLSSIISSVTNGFATKQKAIEIEEFFKAHPVSSAERVIKQSIESVNLTADWIAREQVGIRQWLSTRKH